MTELLHNDLRYVAQRLPRDIRDLLRDNAGHLFVGGGFVRATIAGETPSDIDLFVSSKELAEVIATRLTSWRQGSKRHDTKNAITILTPERLPVQIIKRWTFATGEDLVKSFDFTVCQAAIWRGHRDFKANDVRIGEWRSATGENFYPDLAGRRLVYTSPVREEEAGGSMLRVIKYVKRGYSIQVSSLGAVIGRLAKAVELSRLADDDIGQVFGGLLREVDPLLVVDGFEVVDDHEPMFDAPEAA